jgi:calcineurin-like phosphoesterase family protein
VREVADLAGVKSSSHGALIVRQLKASGCTMIPNTFFIGDTDDPRYINVSAEQINLTPVSLEELRFRMPKLAKAA